MKVYEILSLTRELLERLHGFGITTDDYRWVDMYRDYLGMKERGDKTVYIIAVLSQRYGVCERKIYKIIRKMKQDCQMSAAG